MTIRYKVRYAATQCPNCGTEIMGGHRRFGPKQVQCFCCNKILDTGLTPWAALPAGRKLLLALSELFIPSWNMPVKAFLGNLLAWYFVAAFLAMLGWAFIFAYDDGSGWADTAVTLNIVAAILIGFLLVPGQRLIRMIVESNRYSRTGMAPVWRKSKWLRREGE